MCVCIYYVTQNAPFVYIIIDVYLLPDLIDNTFLVVDMLLVLNAGSTGFCLFDCFFFYIVISYY